MSQNSRRPLCVFCQHGLFARKPNQSLASQQQGRFMAQMQKRKPARMVLSESVRAPRAQPTLRLKPNTKRERGPFAAMNTTRVPRDLKPINHDQPRLRDSSGKGTDQRQRKRNDETFHALKMQGQLSVVSYGHRNALKEEISEIDSFAKFDLLPVIQEAIEPQALAGQEEAAPTPIQRIAIPALINQPLGRRKKRTFSDAGDGMEQFLLAAETGSGKTLAYLLPILHSIKRTEMLESEHEAKRKATSILKKAKDPYYVEPPPLDDRKHPTSGRPRAIVLLPTSELVHQVAQLVRSMAYKVKVRSKGISAADPPHTIRRRVFSEDGIDILVSTPHLIQAITASDPNILSRVRHLVIDEADSLMDRSFSRVVQPIIDKSASALDQLIFCSATIPRSLENHLRHHYPDIRRLVTPALHSIPRRVQLSVVDIEKIPYQGNRNLACADAIYNIDKLKHEPVPGQPDSFSINRVLVFVNEREKSTELAEYLQKKGIDAVAFNRDATDERQSEILKEFTARPPHMSAPQSSAAEAQAEPEQPIATAAASSPGRETEPTFAQATTPSMTEPTLEFLAVKPPATEPLRQTHRVSSWRDAPGIRQLKNVKVLVSTDLLSRGVDTLAVRHVVLYDVPHTATDFIHRLGRVGRMKMRGRGIVLVGRNDRRDVVREVKEAMFRGQALI